MTDQGHHASDRAPPARHPLHGFLDRCLRPLEDLAALFAGVILFCVMVLVSADALMRYALNAPLAFQYTLTEEYLLVALITMALPWGFRTGGYIRIMFLVHRFPPAVGILVMRVGVLVSAGLIAVLAWTAGEEFLKVYESGEARIGVIDWPVWLSWIWVPIGCGLLALRLLLVGLGPVGELHVEHQADEEL